MSTAANHRPLHAKLLGFAVGKQRLANSNKLANSSMQLNAEIEVKSLTEMCAGFRKRLGLIHKSLALHCWSPTLKHLKATAFSGLRFLCFTNN